MKIDYGGVDPTSREGQQMRIDHLKNWRNWPPEELEEWIRAHDGDHPRYVGMFRPKEIIAGALLAPAFAWILIVGIVLEAELRRDAIRSIKRIVSRLWKRS